MPDAPRQPLDLYRPEAVARFRAALGRADFDEAKIMARMGSEQASVLNFSASEVYLQLHRTRGGDPLAALVRLFLIGAPVPIEDLRPVATLVELREWESLGLIRLDGSTAVRSVVATPSQGALLVHDIPPRPGQPLPEFVMGLSASTRTLIDATVRRPFGRALDLGTGSGAQALFAASHCEHVLATDFNPRAVAFARFNVQLNGLTNIDCVEGDLFEPAKGRTFDLIVSNPPFVVSPGREALYRDSGLGGDSVSERILREAPALLKEGGFAHVMCNWVRHRGADARGRITSWLTGSGCDAWVAHHESDPIDLYAAGWIRQDASLSPAEISERFAAWRDYYESEGIETIEGGLVTLRKRTSGPPNWVRVDSIPVEASVGSSAVERAFAGRDALIAIPNDETLLSLRLDNAPDLRAIQYLAPSPANWTVESAQCKVLQGLPIVGELDLPAFHLITLCRGQAPLRDVLQEVARRVGQPPEEVVSKGIVIARRLIDQGCLIVTPLNGAAR
jgi:SAM-dependent methyltransferase